MQIKNMTPAAVCEFLRFKTCDVREVFCIQVESEGEGFSNGKAMTEYINAGIQSKIHVCNRCYLNMAVSVLP